MPTTIHIPPELLQRVDATARAQRVSRNRFIVDSLRKALETHSEWSPAFLSALAERPEDEDLVAFDETMARALDARRSKPPLDF